MNKILLIAYQNSRALKDYINRVKADGGTVESSRCLRYQI